MLLTPAQLDQFHLRGFAKGARVLDDHQIEKLREEMQLVMEGKSKEKPVLNRNLLGGSSEYGPQANPGQKVVVQIVNIWEASPAFLELCKNPEITATVSRLCNHAETLRIWHDQIQYKPPGVGGPTGWHQDFPAWPILQPADLISAWVALDDAEIDNGCMWMVPGSHRWGKVPIRTGEDFQPVFEQALVPDGVETKAEPMPVKKGEVAFHHCMTWHGSPANKTSRPRRAFAIHYMPGYTIYAPTRPHPVEKHVAVKPGEVLQGEKFPVVYERVLQPA
ncbi:MAG: phytanoyl-CoA dioxygenase family protein [Planctomycetota bacterium]|nr:phytanoyl-CoA dioxygenase family protein [Planctomycetota bacterium]